MGELTDQLVAIQDIADRARAMQDREASDPKEFSRQVVCDLGVLAEAVAALIKQGAG